MGVMLEVEDIRIPLSPSQLGSVRIWVDRFSEHELHWVDYPRVEEKALRISALCFPFFLAYVDREDSNEFDVWRLKSNGRREIRRLLKATEPPVQRRYQAALDNMEIIAVGEFLEKKA